MRADRVVAFVLGALLASLCPSANVHAQERDSALTRSLNRVLPSGANGKSISESQLPLAYAAGVLGFILAVTLAIFAVRLFAILLIGACVVGGIGLVCVAIQEKAVTTWEQLAVLTLCTGAVAGVTIAAAEIYLHQGKLKGLEQRLDQLTKDVAKK